MDITVPVGDNNEIDESGMIADGFKVTAIQKKNSSEKVSERNDAKTSITVTNYNNFPEQVSQ